AVRSSAGGDARTHPGAARRAGCADPDTGPLDKDELRRGHDAQQTASRRRLGFAARRPAHPGAAERSFVSAKPSAVGELKRRDVLRAGILYIAMIWARKSRHDASRRISWALT